MSGVLRLDARLQAYSQLMRLDRPIGTLLLLWPTLWALWIAGDGSPKPSILLVFVLGVFLMRSAGCVINDYADRNFDGHVERTRNRPLAVGMVQPKEALMLFCALSLLAFVLVLTLNAFTVWLSIPAVLLAASYPFMKRFTHLPQLVLGAAFSWAIPMAFAAQTGTVPAAAWWLFAANLLWTMAYDTWYAMVDREDDMTVGIKSTAILFGRYAAPAIAVLQVLALAILAGVGFSAGFGWGYFLALVGAAGLFVYQQYLGRQGECFKAFLNNNQVGMLIFVGMVLQ